MICGILAIAAESVYISSRILRTMAHQKLIPEMLAKVDDKGRPRWALGITIVVATFLTYIQLSSGGIIALNWLVSITSSCFFFNWMIISFTSYRFHQTIKAQDDALFRENYAWQSIRWPLAPVWLMTISLLILAGCLAAGINPLGELGFTVDNFFQYMLGILIIVSFTAIYKLVFKTPWRDPKTADLITGRRQLSFEETQQLDTYYSQPKWRRFLTYVQLW